jgi:hypothetical protein
MKTTDEIMRRKWAKEGKNYRVVTCFGNTMYSDSKPIFSDEATLEGAWHSTKELFVFGEAVCEEWARKNYKDSLQSFKEYQKLIEQ